MVGEAGSGKTALLGELEREEAGSATAQELLELLVQRVPPGVDEAAYVKASFLAAVAKGETESPLIDKRRAGHRMLRLLESGGRVKTPPPVRRA